jgi:hypothetical protein
VVRTSATQASSGSSPDQPRQPAGDRGLQPGALQRAGQQRDGLQRLDGLADVLRDVARRDAGGHQLAGPAVAALRRERGGDEVAGPRQADERLGPGAEPLGEAPDLGEDVPGGGAGRVEALGLGRAGGQGGRVLGGTGQLDADRVVAGLADDTGALEERRERQREALVGRGGDQAGALVDHLARVGRTADAAHAVGAELGGEQHGRRRAVRRDQALGQRHDGGATGKPGGRQAGDDGVELGRRHGEQDVVRACQPVARLADLQVGRQRDAGQVGQVLAVGAEALALLRRAGLQGGPDAAARQQHGDRGAERARADDDGAPGAGRRQREGRPRAVGHAGETR